MAEQLVDLNVLKLSTSSLLMIAIVLLLLQCFGYLSCDKKPEALAPWDTFNARFQQGRDDSIGATPSGDNLRMKSYRARPAPVVATPVITEQPLEPEGLTGGYNPPTDGNDYLGEHLPAKEPTDIERTENALKHSLHGN